MRDIKFGDFRIESDVLTNCWVICQYLVFVHVSTLIYWMVRLSFSLSETDATKL